MKTLISLPAGFKSVESIAKAFEETSVTIGGAAYSIEPTDYSCQKFGRHLLGSMLGEEAIYLTIASVADLGLKDGARLVEIKQEALFQHDLILCVLGNRYYGGGDANVFHFGLVLKKLLMHPQYALAYQKRRAEDMFLFLPAQIKTDNLIWADTIVTTYLGRPKEETRR